MLGTTLASAANMRRSMQRGFTLYELLYAIGFFAFWGLVIAVVLHFVLKFW